ncbi:histidine kinase [Streptomyces sp. AJ-1]|uniref:sensor histidine kinase n=1 Tax=Streptomyces sp. AJ-1 TaxID=3044384 RepID=UPI00249AC5E1|nr:histidine kinase [Streptomyces sp. AJ-1]MDI3345848.1 histidine kinase [Streptomyces sp. AJ-1]
MSPTPTTPAAPPRRAYARLRRKARAHPRLLDAVLAAGVLLCMLASSLTDPHHPDGPTWQAAPPDATGFTLMALGAAALVLRRRAPRTVLAATSAASLAVLVSSDPRTPVVMSAAVALYTVAARTDRPTTWRIGLLTSAGLTAGAMLCGNLPWYAQENFGIFAWLGLAAAAGDAVRSRRAYITAIHERADRAERTREEEARRRVAEERLRIARDLHDVVAHHIALVNVQAGVAAHVMDRRPDQAKEALAHVREASRSALDELRATVGLLRQSGDPEAPTEPAPGLARLDDLAERFRNAGLPVEIACPDRGDPLPAAVDLAAYRVVQEALTNVHKHAGPGARAEVSIVPVDGQVEITVLDGGPAATPVPGAAPAEPPPGGGHGLLGMRERVTALGGTCTAGPRFGGGFRVHAILPAQGAAPANRPPAPVPPARTDAPKDGR